VVDLEKALWCCKRDFSPTRPVQLGRQRGSALQAPTILVEGAVCSGTASIRCNPSVHLIDTSHNGRRHDAVSRRRRRRWLLITRRRDAGVRADLKVNPARYDRGARAKFLEQRDRRLGHGGAWLGHQRRDLARSVQETEAEELIRPRRACRSNA